MAPDVVVLMMIVMKKFLRDNNMIHMHTQQIRVINSVDRDRLSKL